MKMVDTKAAEVGQSSHTQQLDIRGQQELD